MLHTFGNEPLRNGFLLSRTCAMEEDTVQFFPSTSEKVKKKKEKMSTDEPIQV